MTIKQFLLAFIIGSLTQSTCSANIEHRLWDKTPLQITLNLNQERLIRFPLPISIVDSELNSKVSILKVQDALYINPHEAFQHKHLIVQLMPNGETLVLNLSTSDNDTDTNPIEILLSEKSHVEIPSINQNLNAITLTRFAIQSLYAPARLLVTPEGISRTPMQTTHHVTLIYGASISATPLISWRGNDLYVTAIELKNQLKREIEVDPRHFLGNWQTTTIYPTNVLPNRGSTTTAFVVSDKPFNEALEQNREFVR